MKNKIYQLVILLFVTLTTYAQNTISGLVTDEDNIPLPGVNVILKNTTTGTVTDFEGKFSISAKSGDVLQISMLGMIPKNITIDSQTQLNISLKSDVANLDEVVVIGYGEVAKKDLTGAVATVEVENLESAPVATFDQALAGRIAGVTVNANEGTPGAPLSITIRGGNSITNSNEPLYVINGIPLEDFDPGTINTSDIESYQVLKDASATAIYGSRGANGVIVITTKSGNTNGTTDVTLNLSSSIQTMDNFLKVMSPYQYVKHLESQAYARDGFQFIGGNDSYYAAFLNRWGDPELYRNVEGRDYQDEAFREAPMNRANFSIRGGNKKTNVFFSTGYVDQEGVLITTGYKRVNTNFTIRHELSDKINLFTGAWYTNSKRYGPRMRTDRGNQELKNIITFKPVDPINPAPGEQEGGFIPGVNDQEYANLFDPIKNLQNTHRLDNANSVRVNTTFTYKIDDNFTLKTTNGYNSNNSEEELFYGLETQQGSRSDNGINGRLNDIKRTTFSTSNTLAFRKNFRGTRVNALVGMEYVKNTFFSSRLWNKNLPTDKFGISNLDVATRPTISLTDESQNRLQSYFGRVNLNLKNKYLFTATFRADGSSKFQDDNKWGYFPSFSGAWQIAQEDFMEDVDFVNTLKLRAGWGITGNNRIGNYASFNQYGIGIYSGYAFGSDEMYQPGAVQSTFAVPDLRWESTAQTNAGIDFSMVDSRISGTVDYYYKKTDDLLLAADMALSTGFNRVIQNVGSVSNQGIEFSLSGLIIDKKDFSWEANFNISTNKNEVLALNSGQDWIKTDAQYDFSSGSTPEYHYISEVGQPVGMMYGFVYDGLYQVEDFNFDPNAPAIAPYVLKDGLPSYRNNGLGPGHVKYVDQNGDGIIDQEDRTIIGNPHPDHFGGLNNSFRFKNFEVDFLLQWSYGFDVFNANRAAWSFPTHNGMFNRLASAAEAWTPTNTDTNVITHFSNGAAAYPPPGYKLDSRYIEDGSYLRLKTLSIAYNVPLQKNWLGLKSCKITLSGQNLFTWTDYSGYDPEISIGNNPLIQNLDFSAYPQNRTYNLALLAKF